MEQVKTFLSENIDKRVVVSVVMASIVLGVAVWAMNKSGVKALKQAAAVVK